MKKIFWTLSFACVMSCTDFDIKDGSNTDDIVVTPVEYIIMPEVVIVATPDVQQQEIIFTEDEVDGSFEDPTAYGAETFSAVYVPND